MEYCAPMILTDTHPSALADARFSCFESPIEKALLEALVTHSFFAGHGEIVPQWLLEDGYTAPEHTAVMLPISEAATRPRQQ